MPPSRTSDPLAGNQTYERVRTLASGDSRLVVLGRHKVTKENVAIKFIERGEMASKYVGAEVLNHRKLGRHPHVIQFKELFLTADYLGIVMEYACYGSLFDYVKRKALDEKHVRFLFQQLIIGLDYCHQRGVANRDIKLGNTLLQKVPGLSLPLLKICDFGLSKAHCMSAPKTKAGILAYMAPEVIQTTTGYDGAAADIWSCGVMLYVMLFQRYPFASAEQAKLENERHMDIAMDRILAIDWSIPPDIKISEGCSDLLHRILVCKEKRIKMEDLLQHPWFLDKLPPGALALNETAMGSMDCSYVQTEDEIAQLLKEARTGSNKFNFSSAATAAFDDRISRTGPNKYNFSSAATAALDDRISVEINLEMS